MNKKSFNFFQFLGDCLYFIKIFAVFLILMILLYWIQQLTNVEWLWFSFVKPIILPFLSIAEIFSQNSIDIFEVNLEYKYPIAIILCIVIHLLVNFGLLVIKGSEELYEKGSRSVRRIQQNDFNNRMMMEQSKIQKAINEYRVLISTSIKKKYSHKELGFDIETENKQMTDFIFDKLGKQYEKEGEAFLYSFDDFEKIDDVLKILLKIVNSNSRIDCIIAVQIFENNEFETQYKLQKLTKLGLLNKICMFSDTRYRYKFNTRHAFLISKTGIYQQDGEVLDVYEVTKM